MDLDREAEAGTGEDRRPHDQVVGERGVDPPARSATAATASTLASEVAVQLALAQLREGLHLEARVAVVDVDGEQAADLGHVGRSPSRIRALRTPDLEPPPSVPRPMPPPSRGAGLAVLAEQVDVVPEPASAWASSAL